METTRLESSRSMTVFLGVFLVTCTFQSVTPCPEMAQLFTQYKLTGYFEGENYTAATWTRPNGGQNVVICNPLTSCSGDDGYSAVANTSQSTLTIDSVELLDIGNWRIKGGSIFTDVCELTAFKRPSCSISANQDTNDLLVGDNLLLTVTITGYYCTLQHSFNLTTGGVTEMLYEKDSETGIQNQTMDTTINVTDSHFGRVTLNFLCEDRQFDLTCTGVGELKERIPTTTTTTNTAETTKPPTLETSPSLGTSSPATPTGSPSGSTGNPDVTGSTKTAPVLNHTPNNTALIAGIIGGVVALIVIVSIIMYISRHRIRNAYDKYIVTKTGRKASYRSDDAELPKSYNSVNLEANAVNNESFDSKE